MIDAAIEYYQYAEVGDYYSTCYLLSYEDQWVAANNALDSAAEEFVVTDVYPDDIGLGVPTYAVMVTVYAADGSSFTVPRCCRWAWRRAAHFEVCGCRAGSVRGGPPAAAA